MRLRPSSLSVAAVCAISVSMAAGCGDPASRTPIPVPTSAAGTTAGSTGAPTAPDTARAPDHVVVAIFENRDYAQIAGAATAPYLNTLLNRGAVMVNAHGVTHPSQPNYLILFSGSDQGITDDRCFPPLANRANLGRQLLDAGRTFVGYSEGLPAAGYTGCTSGRYAAKHNPWAHFANLPAAVNQPFSAFPADFAALPTVSFVVPNLCDDMHDCPTSTGDDWARQHLDPYLQWAETHNSLLIVTFDENDGRPDNTILTVLAGARIRPDRYDEAVDHYRILHTIENLYQLPALGDATAKPPVTDIWR
jgi:hypothetical protein